MKLEFYIDQEHRVIMQSFTGEISIASITHTIPHIWNHPDYSPLFDSIIDFRDSKMLFSKEDLNDLIKKLGEAEKGLQGRIAIMVSDPITAASATLFVEQTKASHSFGIFCSESEVIRFMKCSPEIFVKTEQLELNTLALS